MLHVDTDIILYCYILRYLYTLPTVFADTFYEIFWALACASLNTFIDTIIYYFYIESLTACEAVFLKMVSNVYFSTANKCL